MNLFPINFLARRHLLIAGGIGITPFLSMTEQMGDLGQNFELHYAMTRSGAAPYAAELQSRLGRRFHRYCSDQGERIDLERLLEGQPLGTHLYVCGPERLINATIAMATGLGWPSENIHFERFAGPPPGDPFTVRLAKSGQTIKVGQHQTLLEALERAGVEPPSLCRGGACGQCELPVIAADGELLHYDHFLSEEARAGGRAIMTCVSRLKGRELVLDF
jgi:ferredoxin-NADP reductase